MTRTSVDGAPTVVRRALRVLGTALPGIWIVSAHGRFFPLLPCSPTP
ncbi:hypothetical protein [Streptomyces meridianus]|uniref:Uncharacterized protein n=1 Tax=Streptomyces meridianus TaxID=2938945 RepID=A0ABT0X419_9ACTN|nr:hypothetical protein [Streptomyces meridianus]MCM2577065.1 hypothetical protein [Streptomyces meridianus]